MNFRENLGRQGSDYTWRQGTSACRNHEAVWAGFSIFHGSRTMIYTEVHYFLFTFPHKSWTVSLLIANGWNALMYEGVTSLSVQSPSYLQARLFILHLSRYQSLPVKNCPLAKACPCNLLQTTCSACAPILTASPTEPISTVIKQRYINLCLTWGAGRRSFKLLLKGISDYQLT